MLPPPRRVPGGVTQTRYGQGCSLCSWPFPRPKNHVLCPYLPGLRDLRASHQVDHLWLVRPDVWLVLAGEEQHQCGDPLFNRQFERCLNNVLESADFKTMSNEPDAHDGVPDGTFER